MIRVLSAEKLVSGFLAAFCEGTKGGHPDKNVLFSADFVCRGAGRFNPCPYLLFFCHIRDE